MVAFVGIACGCFTCIVVIVIVIAYVFGSFNIGMVCRTVGICIVVLIVAPSIVAGMVAVVIADQGVTWRCGLAIGAGITGRLNKFIIECLKLVVEIKKLAIGVLNLREQGGTVGCVCSVRLCWSGEGLRFVMGCIDSSGNRHAACKKGCRLGLDAFWWGITELRTRGMHV